MKYNDSNKPIVCMMTNSTCYNNTSTMQVQGILWHSTGANNPTIKRYVQPTKTDKNYQQLINIIGKNPNNNDWNHIDIKAGVNAWIGKLADGSVSTVQGLPWNYRPWGCGSGAKGSCNDGWIQFEICEDNLADPSYFAQVYQEACELTAYLCKMFNINPKGVTKHKSGVIVPTILCHKDSNTLKLGSAHGDVLHWLPKYGKSMDTVRDDVAKLLAEEEDDIVTQAQFNEMMNNYLVELAKKPPQAWSAEARAYVEKAGIFKGDDKGNMQYEKFMTREELAQVLYRVLNEKA